MINIDRAKPGLPIMHIGDIKTIKDISSNEMTLDDGSLLTDVDQIDVLTHEQYVEHLIDRHGWQIPFGEDYPDDFFLIEKSLNGDIKDDSHMNAKVSVTDCNCYTDDKYAAGVNPSVIHKDMIKLQ